MTNYQYPPPPPGGYPATGYPQPGIPQPGNPPQHQTQPPGGGQPPPPQQVPQQGYQTPPYWPPNQTPPQYQQGAMPPQAPPVGPPQTYAIDDAAMAQQYKQAKAEMQGGGAGFLKVLGPQGQKKWDSGVPVGFEGSVFVHVCGPWAQGKPLFARKKKFFWKSQAKPSGTSIILPETGDLVSQALQDAASSPDPRIQQFLKNYKIRTNYLYNVLQLDNPQLHYGQDGVMRPLILDEGKQLHTRIGDVFTAAEGASNIVDYQTGRPIRLVRKKTGSQNMDIEWAAHAALNPAPVPPDFWPALQNLWDLGAFVKVATMEEQQAAILDMGLPMPGQSVQMQVPASYSPGPLPPHGNPYMAPEMVQQYAPPPPPPAPPQQQPPPAFGPPPVMSPPPVYSGQGQAQLPLPAAQVGTPSPASPPPPGLNPPPVTSANPQMPPAAGPPPVPGQAMHEAPGQTPAGPPPPQQGQAQQAPPTLSLPLPPGTTLPEGRERCFGKFNQTDNFCIQCPDWVKGQCVRLSPQQQQAQPADGGLQALQQQMQGQPPQG